MNKFTLLASTLALVLGLQANVYSSEDPFAGKTIRGVDLPLSGKQDFLDWMNIGIAEVQRSSSQQSRGQECGDYDVLRPAAWLATMIVEGNEILGVQDVEMRTIADSMDDAFYLSLSVEKKDPTEEEKAKLQEALGKVRVVKGKANEFITRETTE